MAHRPPTLPPEDLESELDPSSNSRNFSLASESIERKRSISALSKIPNDYPSRRRASWGHPLKKTHRGKLDAEQLTARQREWIELVVDFRGTMTECARVAGYSCPDALVDQMLENPKIVRAILKRYHRRMMKLIRAFAPLPKFVSEVPKPRNVAYVPVSNLRKRDRPETAEELAARRDWEAASSILGEEL